MSELTKYVFVYDIPDDTRRTKIHKILSDFIESIQFSVFEGMLNEQNKDKLISKLSKVIQKDKDKIRIYTLCAKCKNKIQSMGISGNIDVFTDFKVI